MRQIVSGLFMTVDGICDEPGKWSMPYFTDEIGEIIGANMQRSDAMMLGRVLYQDWAAYWPDKTADDDPFAPYINSIQKYVVSTTLDSAEWQPTEILRGLDDVRALKEQDGKDIAISGSLTLVGSLLREGLLDELDLLVSPIVLGKGKRLFETDGKPVGLKLQDSKTLSNGVLSLVYTRA
jgi:dihydrofolate reductase